MKKNKGYTNAPKDIAKEIKDSVSVDDFLPSPEKIALMIKKDETVAITMKLKRNTVERYKRFAHKRGLKYQKFVSTVLDSYAKRL